MVSRSAGGSGSPYVFGVLEDLYKEDMSADEGIDLAVRAVGAAIGRDSASGGMINVAVIDKNGFKEIPEDDVKKRMEKFGKKTY